MDTKWIERHDPIQEVAAEHWEQGLPMGNGKIGAMIWGGSRNRPLTISMDQAEIWEMRAYEQPADKTWTEYKRLLEQGRGDELEGFVFDPLKPHLMRIPVGRLELRTERDVTAHTSRLSLRKARCEGTLTTETGNVDYAVWVATGRQLLVIECDDGLLAPRWKFICRDGDYQPEDLAASTVYPCYHGRFPTITELYAPGAIRRLRRMIIRASTASGRTLDKAYEMGKAV